MAKDPHTISEESIRNQRPDIGSERVRRASEAQTETEDNAKTEAETPDRDRRRPNPVEAADLAEAADRKARLDVGRTAMPKPVASKKK